MLKKRSPNSRFNPRQRMRFRLAIQTLTISIAIVGTIWFYTEWKYAADPLSLIFRPIERIGVIKTEPESIDNLNFSSDGKILTGTTWRFTDNNYQNPDKTARQWDVGTGKKIANFKDNSLIKSSPILSPDRQIIASSGREYKVRLWDVERRKSIVDLESNSRPLRVASFSPDGKIFAGISYEDTRLKNYAWQQWQLHLWDVATGKIIHSLIASSSYASYIAFSDTSQTIAAASDNDKIKIWDVTTGKLRNELDISFPKTKETINSLRCEGDDKLIVEGNEQSIQEWEISTGKWLKSYRFDRSKPKLTAKAGWDSNKGEYTIEIEDATTGKIIRTINTNGEAKRVLLSPDRRQVAASLIDGIVLWDIDSGKLVRTFVEPKRDKKGNNKILSLFFTRDDRNLITGDTQGNAKIWNRSTGNLEGILADNSGAVVSFFPDRDRGILAVQTESPTLKLWDAEKQESIVSFSTYPFEDSLGAIFSPDSRFLATFGTDVKTNEAKILLWDISARKLSRSWVTSCHTEMVFSQDSKSIAAICPSEVNAEARKIKLWDVETGKEKMVYPLGKYGVWERIFPSFATDGKSIAIIGGETIESIDIATSKLISHRKRELKGEDIDIRSIVLSPNGRIFVLAYWGRVELIDAISGELLRIIHTEEYAPSIAFSPDGRTLAITPEYGTIELWRLPESLN